MWISLWLWPAVQAVFTEDLETTWLRKGLGVIEEAIVLGNESLVVSPQALARLDPSGEVVWKQEIHDASNLQNSAGYVLVQKADILEAYDIDSGAKEWSYPDIDSFAVDGELVAVERAGKWAYIDQEWAPLNGKHIYSCNGHLAFEPCPNDVQIIRNKYGITTLIDGERQLWTRHEGLSQPVSACVVAPRPSSPAETSQHWLSNWRHRVQRHARNFKLGSRAHDKSKGLLAVLTDAGSLYALHTSNGSVAWALHEDLSGLVESEEGVIAVTNETTKRLYSFSGDFIAEIPAEDDQNYIKVGRNGSITGPNWEHSVKDLRAVILREKQPTASPGVPIATKDFLYKYINPNLAAVVTANGIELLDGANGSLLARESISEILACEIGEFWVTFLVPGRLHVWYMFESETPNTRSQGAFIEKRQFEAESLESISVSHSKHGVSEQCILATDSAGRVLAFPHSLLRGAPTLSLDDEVPHQFVLSHDLKVDASILLARTLVYESTFVTAALGTDIFCCEFSPSGRFDQLKDFSYFPITVSLLIVTYVTYQLARNYKQDKLTIEWS